MACREAEALLHGALSRVSWGPGSWEAALEGLRLRQEEEDLLSEVMRVGLSRVELERERRGKPPARARTPTPPPRDVWPYIGPRPWRPEWKAPWTPQQWRDLRAWRASVSAARLRLAYENLAFAKRLEGLPP